MIVELSQVRDLMLVNQEHPISWNPQSLVLVGGRVLMDERAACALNKLMEELDGWNFITAVSGWRSQAEKEKFTMGQAAAFDRVICDLNKRGLNCGKIHLLSSDGLLQYPELAGDYARVGIALYGVLSRGADMESCRINLRPVLSVKARVALVKDLYAGEPAGYGLGYMAESNRKIAVLSIGYADGIPRDLSCGKGRVLIAGSEAPIIGLICMDQLLVDVTDIPDAAAGDTAVLIGTSGSRQITACDLAEQTGTITNEILSRLGSRLNRIIV